MEKHDTKAYELFTQGYNCAQSVFLAFIDMTGIDTETAARLSSSFGGGIGRMREVCGAVSGAAMVLGLVKGYDDPTDHSAKKKHYHLVQEFGRRFKKENGSLVCRELLSGVSAVEGRDPEQRTDAYYRKRPCPELVRCAAQILDELLLE